jgi:hypothetical protein
LALRRRLDTKIIFSDGPTNRPNFIAILQKAAKAKSERQFVTSYPGNFLHFYYTLLRWNWELKVIGSKGRQDSRACFITGG